jgi:hypothetical protein
MSHLFRLLTLFVALWVIGCGAGRTAFTPESGPPTVGMPAELNERERLFVPDIEASLRDNGMIPVAHGRGDFALEFAMAAGPINTDTHIALLDGRRTLASGKGRASGIPLIGRSAVAEKSFRRAFDPFQSELSATGSSWNRSTTSGSVPVSGEEAVY